MYIKDHPILGKLEKRKKVKIMVDGEELECYEGEMIAAALLASGKKIFRYTARYMEARGVFCAIGRCTDCVMTVNGVSNIRTCVTSVKEGMIIETQKGLGNWRR